MSTTSLVFAPPLVEARPDRGCPCIHSLLQHLYLGECLAFVFLCSGSESVSSTHSSIHPGSYLLPASVPPGGRSAGTPQCQTLSVTTVPGLWVHHADLCRLSSPLCLLLRPCWVSLSGVGDTCGSVGAVKCQVGERVSLEVGRGYLSISSATFALSMVNVFTLFLFCVPLFPYVLFVRSCIHTFTYAQETQLVILKLVNSGGG